MKKNSLIIKCVIAAILLFSSASSALADGMVMEPGVDGKDWTFLNEEMQLAFINHENGMQKMIIGMSFTEKKSKEAVWIFPVPSKPEDVVIDILDGYPALIGDNILKKAKSSLENIQEYLHMTQLYPAFVINQFGRFGTAGEAISEAFGLVGTQNDVEVYKHLEKEGISTEVVTAKSANSLYEYLKNKNLVIENGSIPVLDSYIGKDYSFVISWISPIQTDIIEPGKPEPLSRSGNNTKGLFVAFPSKDIFFPLQPTSVYGSKIVPATIRVIGYVSPQIPQDIKNYVKIDYYLQQHGYLGNFGNFYSNDDEKISYTKIEINAPSELFKEDLWIKEVVPAKVRAASFINNYVFFISLFLFLICSGITSILVGGIFFYNSIRKVSSLMLLGLSNCFSIIGLIIAAFFIKSKADDEEAMMLIKDLIEKGYFWKRKIAFLLLLFSTPIIFLDIFIIISFFKIGFLYFDSGDFLVAHFFICYAILVPLGMVIGAFYLRKIKPEDQQIFAELKKLKYSTWSFYKKDRKKIAFVPIFSLSFLLVSWIFVKVIELTLR